MPSFVGGALFYDDQFVIPPNALDHMALYALRRMTAHDLAEVPDVGEGFENVLYKAARTARTMEEFLVAVKSKRYTMARVKRIVINALLGVTSDQVHATIASREGSYLRVLGFRRESRALLSQIGKCKRIPLVLRNADIETCPLIVQRNLETDALSSDLLAYATGCDIKRDATGMVVV